MALAFVQKLKGFEGKTEKGTEFANPTVDLEPGDGPFWKMMEKVVRNRRPEAFC